MSAQLLRVQMFQSLYHIFCASVISNPHSLLLLLLLLLLYTGAIAHHEPWPSNIALHWFRRWDFRLHFAKPITSRPSSTETSFLQGSCS